MATPSRRHPFPWFDKELSSQERVHTIVILRGVVKTLRRSNSLSRSVFGMAGSFGKGMRIRRDAWVVDVVVEVLVVVEVEVVLLVNVEVLVEDDVETDVLVEVDEDPEVTVEVVGVVDVVEDSLSTMLIYPLNNVPKVIRNNSENNSLRIIFRNF